MEKVTIKNSIENENERHVGNIKLSVLLWSYQSTIIILFDVYLIRTELMFEKTFI